MGDSSAIRKKDYLDELDRLTVELVKHELTHLVLHVAEHPAAVFQRIEQYRGP